MASILHPDCMTNEIPRWLHEIANAYLALSPNAQKLTSGTLALLIVALAASIRLNRKLRNLHSENCQLDRRSGKDSINRATYNPKQFRRRK